ncbi:MAG: hypothetical protein COW71_13585 [Ignavibacteriales bacterium CG18_big_fil_WC_8_21_14_2_50_31_20]|nr:MAG: hypothetical protein COW71_13585 [Ignavibacteriales bacterium CG18_big_fil_WC_8_21_14_2_50_31_20]
MSKLFGEYLKRENTFFNMIGGILPDPDKILAERGGISAYKDLLIDPHLTATILQRKMQVLQMGWEVESENDELRKEGIEIMRGIPLQIVGSQILDSILFGYNVSEIIWEKKGGKLVPIKIQAKPLEWFAFDGDNNLKIVEGAKQKGKLLEIPKYKFLLAQHKPTFDNPYGEKILSKCYWPVKIKQTTVESWMQLIEKFGIPYLIGVVSDSATPDEREAVINNLLEMIDSNVATRKVSETIEIKEQTSYEVGQLFEKMSEFQNKEISKAVLSVTLTVDVGTSGSYKASDVHRSMLEYIGVSDKKLIESCINQMFDYYVELNYGTSTPLSDHTSTFRQSSMTTPLSDRTSTALSNHDKKIRVKLTKKEQITEETANRDKMLSEIGVKFTKEYFMKKYNLSSGDFDLVTVE